MEHKTRNINTKDKTRQIAVWMLTTTDKYELPIFVADSCAELAAMCNTTSGNIFATIGKAKARGGRCKYVKVLVDADDE